MSFYHEIQPTKLQVYTKTEIKVWLTFSEGKKRWKKLKPYRNENRRNDSLPRDMKRQSFNHGSRCSDSCTQSLNLVYKMCCQSQIIIDLSPKGDF